MKPPQFGYVAAASVRQAVEILAEHDGEAKLIAGGQSLMPMLNFRLLQPSVLVDIGQIAELDRIAETERGLSIGARTRHCTLEHSPLIAEHFPVLAHAMSHVAHLAIRNRGTIGGSLSHADPAAELPMMAMLLDAEIAIVGASGERRVTPEEFFLGALTTDLEDDEMVVDITLPFLPAGTGWGFEEVSRRSGDFALAAAAAILTVRDGAISEARLAVMGVDETPLRIADAEKQLQGKQLEDALLAEAAEIVQGAVQPNTDLQASADYRRHLIGVLTRRVLSAAWARAGGESQ